MNINISLFEDKLRKARGINATFRQALLVKYKSEEKCWSYL